MKLTFTDRKVEALKPPKDKAQAIYSDEGCPCLSLVVGKRAKTFRSAYLLRGKWQSRCIGRFGDYVGAAKIDVEYARQQVKLDAADAAMGKDPLDRKPLADAKTFHDVVTEYLGIVNHRAMVDTRRVLMKDCEPLHRKPMAQIERQDIQEILDHHRVTLGHSRTAQTILVRLKTLWRWADKRDYVDKLVPDKCESLHVGKPRDRVYSGEEIRALWEAAGTLADNERDFVRLLVLLVPRKTALARMERSHLNDDVSIWTTPFELVKAKATSRPYTYKTPLPPLARSILVERLRATNGVYLFGSDVPLWPGAKIVRKLVKAGAPRGFAPHSLRHTCASMMEDWGHSLWERGLILNHAATGITANYSHGDPR